MVQEQNLINQTDLLTLVTNDSLRHLSGVSAHDLKAWRAGQSQMSLEDIGRITVLLLKQRKIYVSSDSHVNAKERLLVAKDLNDKLSESAEGPNNTLHKLIDESLSTVFDFIK